MMTFADDSEKQGNIPRSQEEVINWLPISSIDSKADISFFFENLLKNVAKFSVDSLCQKIIAATGTTYLWVQYQNLS